MLGLDLYFNPRSHKGNDISRALSMILLIDFNPRSHKGNDHGRTENWTWTSYFNPRSHKGNDPPLIFYKITPGRFQSTFPQGERRYVYYYDDERVSISIHVPTRGTTVLDGKEDVKNGFQSTFPQGERHDDLLEFVRFLRISIHVPTRGTTHGTPHMSLWDAISIHVPTRGTTF